MNYEKIDIENWARKEHYRYYTEKLKIYWIFVIHTTISFIRL